jgi:hypothetical protein
VLKDDFESAVSLMKQIGKSGDVTEEDYQEWPLFNKFRKTKHFVETYREIFKTEFEIRNVPPEVASALSLSHEASAAFAELNKKKRRKQNRVPAGPISKAAGK